MNDVVVIGGGVIGCATAAFLLFFDPALSVTVIEPDPTYGAAASPLASGGVRQLFSRPENILMSAYTLEAIDGWSDFLIPVADLPRLGWRQQGYLVVADVPRAHVLAKSLETQRASGVNAIWLEPYEITRRFPALRSDDLGGAVFSPDDGWLDPYAFLQGLRLKADRLGANFVKDRVVGLEASASAVREVFLASGRRIKAEAFVNCAGCWAPGLAAQVGMHLPVEPMRRFEHYAETSADLTGMPFVKDFFHLAVRPEGRGVQAGLVDWNVHRGLDPGGTGGSTYFDDAVWPALAHRLPALDRLQLKSSWSGFYDTNSLDGNMIIGTWVGHLDNFYVACGFSGHGMMHAPAVGRALSELILHREFRTLDLARLQYQRVLDNRPYPEHGVI